MPEDVTERFITRLPTEIVDGRVIIHGDRGQYEILYDASSCTPKLNFECFTISGGKEDRGNIIDFISIDRKKEMCLKFEIISCNRVPSINLIHSRIYNASGLLPLISKLKEEPLE